jgi:transcriptional antiterminator RfaH
MLDSQSIIPASFQKGPAWFVVFVEWSQMRWDEDKNSFKLERDIKELGFETFAPPEKLLKIVRQRRRIQIKPAFGRYMFVRFDREADNWGQLMEVRGVYGVLSNAYIPMRIPDIVIERIRRAEQAGAFGLKALEPGTAVEIMEGPWTGFIAKVLAASPKKRAKLLLGSIGKLDIDPCFLRKV